MNTILVVGGLAALGEFFGQLIFLLIAAGGNFILFVRFVYVMFRFVMPILSDNLEDVMP